MQLHTLKPFEGASKSKRRLGRGHGSGRGRTAGRGEKGQRARSGGKGGLKLRGLRAMVMSLPKTRGFRSIHEKPAVVNLDQLEKAFEKGALVSAESLAQKKLVRRAKSTKGVHAIKLLGRGNLTIALTVKGVEVSDSAREKITQAGGTVE